MGDVRVSLYNCVINGGKGVASWTRGAGWELDCGKLRKRSWIGMDYG